MRTTTRVLLLSSLAIASCQEKSKPTATKSEGPAATAPRPQARRAATPVAKNTGRDVTKLDACEIVPGAEVAKITGGKLVSPSNLKGPLCGYVLEKNGKTISYQLSFWKPAPYEAMFEAAPASQLGEKIAGPWSTGYLDKGMAEGTFNASVVWNGDVAMESQGDGKDAVLALAKLAASRLPPP